MRLGSSAARFGVLAQALHWIVVVGIIASWIVAEAAEDEERGGLLGLHRSIGLTIFALAVVRVGWRFFDPRPAWPAGMAGWERSLARLTHALLYVLLFAIPLTGWLLSSAEGDPVSWFGLFELRPVSVAADDDVLEDLHEVLFNVLVATAALHTLAALKHHFVNRDGVLRSMLPRNPGR